MPSMMQRIYLVGGYLEFVGSDQWVFRRDMSRNNEQVQTDGKSEANAELNDDKDDSLRPDAEFEDQLGSWWYTEGSHESVFQT